MADVVVGCSVDGVRALVAEDPLKAAQRAARIELVGARI